MTGTDWVIYSQKKNLQKTYFRCNRSGRVEVKQAEERGREVKGLFSTKTNTECASHLVLTVKDGKYLVKFCTDHTSHPVESEFLRIATATKRDLEHKLKQGISAKTILKSLRPGSSSTYADSKLVTNKTLENLINKCSIGKDYQLHSDDGKSVDDFVKADGGKTVILYKPVGKIDEKYPKLGLGDFGLAIMNDQQKEVLTNAMISPPGAIFADATHKTNQYDLKLITIMTINSFGNGMPVAFFFCTKEDADALSYLFSAIKSSFGNLSPKFFLTDDASAYWNAFKATMDCPSTKRLLCIWHVDRNWRKKCKELIKHPVARIEVYQKLFMLRSESDEEKVKMMVTNFIALCNKSESTKSFAQYFETSYSGRLEL